MACIAAINTCTDDTKCRKYVLNFIEATRQLKSNPFKVINATSLIRSKRLKGAVKVFNPLIDAPDLLSLASTAMRS